MPTIMKKKKSDENFIEALVGKEIPILTSDPKWKLLFGDDEPPAEISETAKELEKLMAVQSASREKIKELKRTKKDLLNEIIRLRSLPQTLENEGLIQMQTVLIDDANAKLEQLEEEQIGVPRQIYDSNLKLMLQTMDFCYRYMAENSMEIGSINNWISDIRIELKKQLIKKQESELDNYNMYMYMHQILGPEVIDLFDMKYDPERWHPVQESDSEYV